MIGEARSQRLDVIPAQYRLIVTAGRNMPIANARRVVQAPAPVGLIEGGLPTGQLVAHVLVAKCADHSALYRQCRILARQGIAIERSVLALWVVYAAAEVKPLWRLVREELLRSTKLFVDETTAPVLDPGGGRSKEGSSGCSPVTTGRGGAGRRPRWSTTTCRGAAANTRWRCSRATPASCKSDGYALYGKLTDPKRAGSLATLAFCWAIGGGSG